MPADPLIEAQGLGRSYYGRIVLHHVDLSVGRGEVLGFLGPNGAGKTTTLAILTGTIAPTTGTVHIDGFDLARRPRQAKRRLGYLPEHPPLYPELTVAEYLCHCGRLRGIPRRAVRNAAREAAGRCGVDGDFQRVIDTLSRGTQQRVGMAQALVHRPAVMILDEPTVGLDPHQARAIRTLLRGLAKDHAIILSTHHLPDVHAVCDRVLILNQGRVVHTEDLAGKGDAPGLVISLRQPPSLDALARLAGITHVEPLGERRFRLSCEPGNAAETVAEQAVRQGWGLEELTPARPSLEQTFLAVTQAEPS